MGFNTSCCVVSILFAFLDFQCDFPRVTIWALGNAWLVTNTISMHEPLTKGRAHISTINTIHCISNERLQVWSFHNLRTSEQTDTLSALWDSHTLTWYMWGTLRKKKFYLAQCLLLRILSSISIIKGTFTVLKQSSIKEHILQTQKSMSHHKHTRW